MPRIFALVFLVLIACWFALALAGGVAAAAIFPAARELELSLAGYEEFIALRPTEGRMLVAGFLAESVFSFSNGIRLVVAPLSVVAFLALGSMGGRTGLLSLRGLAIAVASLTLMGGVLWVQPEFSARDREYRAAARAGDVDAAEALKSGVDLAHGRAATFASIEAIALLVAIAASAGSGRRIGRGDSGTTSVPVGWGSRRG